MKVFYVTILLFSKFLASAWASAGDQADDFIQCVQLCKIQNCGTHSTYTMPFMLRLTHWTCSEDCNYNCMHQITAKDVRNGDPVNQYHGKWPFWRFAGAQEPASVLFSLLNLAAHWYGRNKVKRKVPDNHPMKLYYLRWSFVSMNAWVWSAVFHTRDRPTTEKLDYFSAALAIMYALYYTILRVFQLYPTSQIRLTPVKRPAKSLQRRILAILCIVAYTGHVSYLTLLTRFDYTYNMAFNLTLALINNLVWILYSLPSSMPSIRRFPSQPRSYRPEFVGKAGVFVLVTTTATALELFDFPPWGGVIDAHSLWHLATAPIVFKWYDFLVEDSLDPSWRDHRL